MSEPLVARDEPTAGVVRLTIQRPEALNALNQAVLEALEAQIAALASDGAVRCVVVTGVGRSFVAGADIAAMRGMVPEAALAFAELGHGVMDALERLPVPVIAAVNGFALGGGCELSLACDLVYAHEKARFGQPEVGLGLMAGFGGTQRLARRVGAMRALELLTTGRAVKAQEACALGLCLDVFAVDELMAKVLKVAERIAAQGPVAVRATKAALKAGLDTPLAAGNAAERAAFAELFASADAQEGMGAFLEKRRPAWVGR